MADITVNANLNQLTITRIIPALSKINPVLGFTPFSWFGTNVPTTRQTPAVIQTTLVSSGLGIRVGLMPFPPKAYTFGAVMTLTNLTSNSADMIRITDTQIISMMI